MRALLTETCPVATQLESRDPYSCLSINTEHAAGPLVAVYSLKLIGDCNQHVKYFKTFILQKLDLDRCHESMSCS